MLTFLFMLFLLLLLLVNIDERSSTVSVTLIHKFLLELGNLVLLILSNTVYNAVSLMYTLQILLYIY